MKWWQNTARNLRKSHKSTAAQKQAQPFKNAFGIFLPNLFKNSSAAIATFSVLATQAEGTSRQIDCKAFTTSTFMQYGEEGCHRWRLPALPCLAESGLWWCRSPLGNMLASLPLLWTAVKGMGQAMGKKMLTVVCLLNLAIKETPKQTKQKVQTTNQKKRAMAGVTQYISDAYYIFL